jgi:hypothetical protein
LLAGGIFLLKLVPMIPTPPLQIIVVHCGSGTFIDSACAFLIPSVLAPTEVDLADWCKQHTYANVFCIQNSLNEE